MRRREFMALAGGTAAWPLATQAQQPPKLLFSGTIFAKISSSHPGTWYLFPRFAICRLGFNDVDRGKRQLRHSSSRTKSLWTMCPKRHFGGSGPCNSGRRGNRIEPLKRPLLIDRANSHAFEHTPERNNHTTFTNANLGVLKGGVTLRKDVGRCRRPAPTR